MKLRPESLFEFEHEHPCIVELGWKKFTKVPQGLSRGASRWLYRERSPLATEQSYGDDEPSGSSPMRDILTGPRQ